MKPIFVIICLFLFNFALVAQTPVYDFLDINEVSARINSNGNHFWDQQGVSHYRVPKDEMTNALFSFVLWVGGVDTSQYLHMAADRYSSSGQDYWRGPISNSVNYTAAYDSAWNYVWKINKSEIDYHKSHYWVSGYTPPAVILNWPGNGDPALGQALVLAPFFDQNNNGIYEPMLGDYPLIKGDQTVFFIINDHRSSHTESGGLPLGIEIHGMAYGFDCVEDSALLYATFMHYDIYNRSSLQYHDTYMGAFADTDLGFAWDDYVGCDVGRGSFYTYNGDNIDGSGEPDAYGAFPPAIATTLLAGPWLDADTLDNPKTDLQGNQLCDLSINGANFGDGVVDNERYGMSMFWYFTNCASGPTCDPHTAAQYYSFMEGTWKDSVPMQYGGNGHPNAGATGGDCHFMFPDLSDNCNWGTNGLQPPGYITGAGGTGLAWNEPNVGNPPNDRRGTITMGPFTCNPGDHQQLDFAFVWARQYTDSSSTAVLPLLKSRIDLVRTYFTYDSIPCGASFSGISPPGNDMAYFNLYPNPASSLLNVDYKGITKQVDFVIVNILGETLVQGKLYNNDPNQVSVGNLAPGIYLLVVRDRGEVTGKRFVVR